LVWLAHQNRKNPIISAEVIPEDLGIVFLILPMEGKMA
jgi:hypothetical protein